MAFYFAKTHIYFNVDKEGSDPLPGPQWGTSVSQTPFYVPQLWRQACSFLQQSISHTQGV